MKEDYIIDTERAAGMLRKYFLLEARDVHRTFDRVIYDIAEDVRNTIITGRYLSLIEPEYTGWCYDNTAKQTVRSERPDKFHPIFIIYADNSESEGLMFTPVRIVKEMTPEYLDSDPIYVGINLHWFVSEESQTVDKNHISRIETLLAHEFTHVRDMWEFDHANIVDTGKNTGYALITGDFLKSNGITEDVPGRIIQSLRDIFNIMSDAGLRAVCEASDKFIRNPANKFSILNVLSEVRDDETKVLHFIRSFYDEFGYPFTRITRFMKELDEYMRDSRYNKMFCLLFTQISVYFGMSDDKTGGHLKTSQWEYTNRALAGNKFTEISMRDSFIDAIREFREQMMRHMYMLTKSVESILAEEKMLSISEMLISHNAVYLPWTSVTIDEDNPYVPNLDIIVENMADGFMKDVCICLDTELRKVRQVSL